MDDFGFAGPGGRALRQQVLGGTSRPYSRAGAVWTAAWMLLFTCAFIGVGTPSEEAASDGEAVLALAALPAPLPLETNERVEHWMRRFRTDERPAFQDLLERRAVYQGLVGDKLRERRMPADLFSVAMIESWLSPLAESAKSAVGLWQFTGPTAAQYGLRVDEWVDERRDPVRATDAALDYLAWLYDRYDSWYLAAAAYNAGPTRVDGILEAHAGGRSGDEAIYWEVLEHFPFETREYVPRLVAATLVAHDAEAHGFRVSGALPYRYDQVFVPGNTSLARVASAVNVDGRVMRNLNPHLIRGMTPPNEAYPIRVPVGSARFVMAHLARRTSVRKAD